MEQETDSASTVDSYTLTAMPGWLSYQSNHEIYPFSFLYPADWKLETRGQGETSAVEVYDPSTEVSNETELYRDSMSIYALDNSGCVVPGVRFITVSDESALSTSWGAAMGGTHRAVCINTRSGNSYYVSLFAREESGQAAIDQIFSSLHF